MDVPIMWIALVIGGILLALGLTKKGKSKKTGKAFLVIGAIGLAVALASYMGWAGVPQVYPLVAGVTTTTTTTPAPSISGVCPPGLSVEDTTVTLEAIDKYTTGAAGGTHRYRLNGAGWKEVSDAGTFTASPSDKLEIVFMNASSTSYLSEYKTDTIPCVGTKTYTANVVQNGTTSIDVFNEEGNLIDDAANNETLAAEDIVTLEIKIKGTYQKGIPHGGVIIAEYNDTVIDDIKLDFGLGTANIPAAYVIRHGIDSEVKAFKFPALLSNEIITASMVIDAGSTDPTAIDADDIYLKIFQNDYYFDEDQGGIVLGPTVEDEDDVFTFGPVAMETISVS